MPLLTIESYTPKPPIGRCIYCGTTDGPLTDEHVLPRGLRGQLILYEASCSTCQRLINTFETAVLHKTWGLARTKLDFPTYNKRGRPRSARVDLQHWDTVVTRDIPIADAPAFIVLPRWHPPGYFTGLDIPVGYMPAKATPDGRPDTCVIPADAGAVDRLKDSSLATGLRMVLPVTIYSLARLLAKIAYGYIVYTYGMGQLAEVFVLPGILGQREDLARWVGGSEPSVLDSAVPYSPPRLHQVAHAVDGDLVQVFIRLFARMDPQAPEYGVVVGRLRAAAVEQWLS
jgi:hypothetical protein